MVVFLWWQISFTQNQRNHQSYDQNSIVDKATQQSTMHTNKLSHPLINFNFQMLIKSKNFHHVNKQKLVCKSVLLRNCIMTTS